jgi:uncharacterized RDD family membrane protein YckC
MKYRRWGEALSTERVEMNSTLTQATVVPRFVAASLDQLFALITAIAVAKAVPDSFPAVQAATIFLAYIAYYFVLEGLFARTPGKLIARLAVVRLDGRRCGWRQSAVRNLFRVLEVNPLLFGALPAAVSIYFSPQRQRIGDRVAGTLVVHSRR